MSLEFNADKQIIKSTNPQLIGSGDLTIRSGTGSDEKEVFRVQLDSTTKLPRIGVNRTGQKIEKIETDFEKSNQILRILKNKTRLTGGSGHCNHCSISS